jgi:hypothetical protein
MAESVRARVQRHRDHARSKGLVRVEVELPSHLLALRRADETVKALLIRALTALLPPATRPTTPPLPETLPETQRTPEKLPEMLPETSSVATDDAQLLALLAQTTPRLTYLEIGQRLGLPEGTIKRKAAPWIKDGLVPKRPRGGARPRRARGTIP